MSSRSRSRERGKQRRRDKDIKSYRGEINKNGDKYK
jgi:hypothetical protein